jgi:hypothetical protein
LFDFAASPSALHAALPASGLAGLTATIRSVRSSPLGSST